MAAPRRETLQYKFSKFRLDVVKRLLLCNDQAVPLAPKIFDTLLALVENSGPLVTKDELMSRSWLIRLSKKQPLLATCLIAKAHKLKKRLQVSRCS